MNILKTAAIAVWEFLIGEAPGWFIFILSTAVTFAVITNSIEL